MSSATLEAPFEAEAAKAHAREVVKRSRTSFGPGMRILSKPRREAMFAVYAFCREVDDIADEGGTRDEKMAGLKGWREEIERVYAGRPAFPTGAALIGPIASYDLKKQEFIFMIEGMEMDADGPVIAPSMERFFAYTRRVAGAVGMLSMPIFGAPPGEASDRFALALADALQITNILRDVGEDAEEGRLYLPAELLEKHDVPKDPARVLGAPGLGALGEELGAIAAGKFAEARSELERLDWRTVRPALMMMGVYETYLRGLRRRGWEKTGEKLTLSKFDKIRAAARYAAAPPPRLSL